MILSYTHVDIFTVCVCRMHRVRGVVGGKIKYRQYIGKSCILRKRVGSVQISYVTSLCLDRLEVLHYAAIGNLSPVAAAALGYPINGWRQLSKRGR